MSRSLDAHVLHKFRIVRIDFFHDDKRNSICSYVKASSTNVEAGAEQHYEIQQLLELDIMFPSIREGYCYELVVAVPGKFLKAFY